MFKYNYHNNEKKIINDFNRKGYLIFDIKNINKLNKIKKEVEKIILNYLQNSKIKINSFQKKNCWILFINFYQHLN